MPAPTTRPGSAMGTTSDGLPDLERLGTALGSGAFRQLIQARDKEIADLHEALRQQEEAAEQRLAAAEHEMELLHRKYVELENTAKLANSPQLAEQQAQQAQQLASQQQQVLQQAQLIDQLQRRLSEAELRNEALRQEAQQAASRAAIAAAAAETKVVYDQVSGLGVFKKLLENKERQVKELQDERLQLERERTQLLEQIRSLERSGGITDVAEAAAQLHTLRDKYIALSHENSDLRDRFREAEEVLRQKEALLQQMSGNLRQKSQQVGDMTREIRDLDLRCENFLKQLGEAKEDLRAADAEIRACREEIRARDEEEAYLQSEVERLAGRVREVEAERDAMRKVAEAARRAHGAPGGGPGGGLVPSVPHQLAPSTATAPIVGNGRNSLLVTPPYASALNIFGEHYMGCCVAVTGSHKEVGYLVLTGSGSYEGECWIQWYRSLNGSSFAPIEGAVNPSYLPTADDVGCVLRLECTPVGVSGGRGQAFSADTTRIALDGHMDKLVRNYMKQGRAQLTVMLTGDVPDEQRTLLLDKSGIVIMNKMDGTEVSHPYSPSMGVELHPWPHMTFTLRADGSTAYLLRTTTSLERDLCAHAIRQFISLMRERAAPLSASLSTAGAIGVDYMRPASAMAAPRLGPGAGPAPSAQRGAATKFRVT
eukprot:tig00000792_g4178.t1